MMGLEAAEMQDDQFTSYNNHKETKYSHKESITNQKEIRQNPEEMLNHY